MNTKNPHVAIIILNWNGLKDTMECLSSVLKNDYSNYSIFLVDNASAKDELKIIKNLKDFSRKKPLITYIQNHSNLGFAEGNNVGIKKAFENEAKYIFLLNNDTIVDSAFLTESVKTIQNKEKKIGIVATTMVNYYNRNTLDNIGHDILNTGDTIPRGRNENKHRLSTLKYQSNPMGACAGATLYSSKMLKEVGLLDKDFFLNYEDSDLSLRAIVQGWKCVWSQKAVIYHKLNASIGKIKNDIYRIRSQRNQLWAYLHNTPSIVIMLNLPWIILRDFLVIFISLITFRWNISNVFIKSRIEIIKTLPKIIKKRKKVMKNKKISDFWYWKQQRSCITTYWKYFKEIIIEKRSSTMEKNRSISTNSTRNTPIDEKSEECCNHVEQ